MYLAPSGAIFREATNQGSGGNNKQTSSSLFNNFPSSPLSSPTSAYLSGVGVAGSGGGSRIHEDDLEAEIAFRYAVQRINRDRNILPNTTLVYDIAYVGKDDSFHAAKRACGLINRGALAIFGPNDDRIGVHVQSVCDAVDIPHLESRLHNLNSGKEFSINLHPGAYSKAQSLRVLIAYLNWTQIGVIYEDDISKCTVDGMFWDVLLSGSCYHLSTHTHLSNARSDRSSGAGEAAVEQEHAVHLPENQSGAL